MLKTSMIFLISFTCSLIIVCKRGIVAPYDGPYLCTCLIYPNGRSYNTYLIEVSKDSVITTTLGTRSQYTKTKIAADEFIDIEKNIIFDDIQRKTSRKLNQTEYNCIKERLWILRKEEFENNYVKDGWSRLIQYGDKQRIILVEDRRQEQHIRLTSILMDLSPISIDMSRIW